MTFLNPIAFLAAVTIPIVVLMHFLKLRRQNYVVPSVMLWLEAVEDMKANVPFQRLRSSLLLILQLILVGAVIVSMARPALPLPGALMGQSILIIENSARMQATASGESRLDLAKVEALKQVERLHGNAQMMVIDTSQPPSHLRQTFTMDKDKLRHAIMNLPENHTSPNFKDIFDSIKVYGDAQNSTLFLIANDFDESIDWSGRLHRIGIGEKGDNVGIVQFSVTRDSNAVNRSQVLAGVQNFTDEPQSIKARLEVEGTELDDETVVLAEGEQRLIVFTLDDNRFDGQVITVRLEREDDLRLDNTASAILHPPSKWGITLVSAMPQPLLMYMLEALNGDLTIVNPHDYHGLTARDIVIFDRFVPETLPEGNIIFFNPVDGLPFMPVQQSTSPTQVIEQHPTHDVMRDVSLIDLHVQASLRCDLPVWGTSLVETTQGSLIWIGTQDEGGRPHRKVVVFAFDPFNLEISRFALFEKSIASAPILISQCLAWLGSGATEIAPDVVTVGEPVTIRLNHPDGVAGVYVQLPDGSQTQLKNISSEMVFHQTSQVGIYTVMVDDRLFGRFAVNLLDSHVSDLVPPAMLGGNHQNNQASTQIEPSQRQTMNREIWHYTAFLALALIVVEWWVYHRGQAS